MYTLLLDYTIALLYY